MNDDSLIDELLDRWEDAQVRGETLSLEDLCAECPELKDEVERRIQALGAIDRRFQTGLAGTTGRVETKQDFEAPSIKNVEVQSDFRDLRFHAKGGLGSVYRAIDERLNRDIAVKFIHHRLAGRRESRERFALEAEVTGLLDHPGVVPLYGLGETHDGRMFYAMRFVDGDTLDDSTRDYHEEECSNAQSSNRSLQFRKLLGHFVDLCNIVDYAHSRGVLHRDIKPNNVMLGQHGETVLVDWGLAKILRNSVPEDFDDWAEGDTLNKTGSSVEPTQLGSLVGTPAYMSPEQARGDIQQIGPASDIYSLGASLYYLLTGRPSQTGEKLSEVLANVQSGTFARPRAVAPRVSKQLEAICLKAMAVSPEERYASAEDLAGDVERWLADEPVAAYQDTIADRTRRWLRRHRTLAMFAACASMLIVLLSVVAAALIGRAWQNEKTARGLATANESKAKQAAELAERNAAEAEQRARVARARELALSSQSQLESNPRLAALLAVEACRALEKGDPSVIGAHIALRRAIKQLGPGRSLPGHESYAVGRSGRWLATGHADGVVRLWDLATTEPTDQPIELNGHASSVVALEISNDGSWLASGSSDRTVRLWKLDSRLPNRVAASAVPGSRLLTGHSAKISGTWFSPNSRWLLTADRDQSAFLWDLSVKDGPGSAIALPALPGSVARAVFDEAGHWLVTSYVDSPNIQLWDCDSSSLGESVRTIENVELGVDFGAPFALDPRGKRLATGPGKSDPFGDVRLWDLAESARFDQPRYLKLDQQELGTRGPEIVRYMRFTADGRHLVTQSAGSWLWNLEKPDEGPKRIRMAYRFGHVPSPSSGARQMLISISENPNLKRSDREYRVLDLLSPTDEPSFVSFNRGDEQLLDSDDGEWALARSDDGWAELVSLDSQADDPERFVFVGMYETVDRINVVANSQLTWLVTEDRSSLRLWALNKSQRGVADARQVSESGADSASFSNQGRLLFSGDVAGLFDPASPNSIHPLASPEQRPHYCSKISPNGKWAVVGLNDYSARVFDVGRIDTLKPNLDSYRINGVVTSLAFSPDDRWLLTTGDKMQLWDLDSDQPFSSSLELASAETLVGGVEFSPDSKWAVTTSDSDAWLWDISGENPADNPILLKGHTGTIWSVAFSPDGNWIASGSADHTVRLWHRSPDGVTSTVLRGHEASVCEVAFSPDGRWLASCGDTDRSARLWNLRGPSPGARSYVLRAHTNDVETLAFSAEKTDTHWLITGALDGSVRLWDLRSRQPSANSVGLEMPPSHLPQMVNTVRVSPDGKWIVAGGNCTVLWPLQLEDLLSEARLRCGRNLTKVEQRRFFPEMREYRRTFSNFPAEE